MQQGDVEEPAEVAAVVTSTLFESVQRPLQAGVVRSRDRCIGSGVPGDVWEHGHSIVPGTAEQMFTARRSGRRALLPLHRCRRCSSTRYNHRRQDCKKKAASTHRDHRAKLVRKGFAADVVQAADLMNGNGVTREFIAELLRSSFGTTCPGLCCDASLDEAGRIVIVRYRISRLSDLEFDWRDPRFMLTPENCGPLCATCNRQKGEIPWPEFVGMQRAVLRNLEQSTPGAAPARQLTLELW